MTASISHFPQLYVGTGETVKSGEAVRGTVSCTAALSIPALQGKQAWVQNGAPGVAGIPVR